MFITSIGYETNLCAERVGAVLEVGDEKLSHVGIDGVVRVGALEQTPNVANQIRNSQSRAPVIPQYFLGSTNNEGKNHNE